MMSNQKERPEDALSHDLKFYKHLEEPEIIDIDVNPMRHPLDELDEDREARDYILAMSNMELPGNEEFREDW